MSSMTFPLTSWSCMLLVSLFYSWLAVVSSESALAEDRCDSEGCVAAISHDFEDTASVLSMLQVAKKAEKQQVDAFGRMDASGAASEAIMADKSLGFHWKVISDTAACEENGENITVRKGQAGISLPLCRAWCMAWETCEGVDFYKSTGWCNVYDKICKGPKLTKDGASSFRLHRKASFLQQSNSGVVRKAEQRTPPDQPPKLWIPISETAACEENREGIRYTAHRPGYTVDTCKVDCENTENCRAIDFYKETGWCIFYDRPCTTPGRVLSGSSSYRLLVEDDKSEAPAMMQSNSDSEHHSQSESSAEHISKVWLPISTSKACEDNHEGIAFMDHAPGFTIDTCKKHCEETEKCVAVDFYSESTWCILYDKACKAPLRSMSGSSSHRLGVEAQRPEPAAMMQTAKFPTGSSSTRDVERFMMEFGSPWAAAQMIEDEIDGEAFLQLLPEDLKEYGLKRGPALKLYKHIQTAVGTSAARNSIGTNALHEVVGPDGVLLIASPGRREQSAHARRKLDAVSINATLLFATDESTASSEELEHGCALDSTPGVKDSCSSAHKTGYGCASKAEQAIATSHLRALQEAKKRNRDWTAILEDSAVPVPVDNWSAIFRKAWQKVPPRTQMVRLGWCQIDTMDYQDPVIHHVHSNVSGAILTQRIGFGKFSGKPFVYEPGGCSTAYMVHRDILEDLISLFPCCGGVDACYKWDFLKQVNPKTGVERGLEIMMNIDSNHHQTIDGVIEHHGLMVQDGDALKVSMLQKGRAPVKVRHAHSAKRSPAHSA
mmetsp:Transcript_61331/g.109287  ORF Transcript_61331/g.109287 Transcript_61331/m.109287 type:complete len:777 (-) Transcript_61331:67-2397(-)